MEAAADGSVKARSGSRSTGKGSCDGGVASPSSGCLGLSVCGHASPPCPELQPQYKLDDFDTVATVGEFYMPELYAVSRFPFRPSKWQQTNVIFGGIVTK
ncbi:hypothetical protein FKM82_008469 [Ascaphus truei]